MREYVLVQNLLLPGLRPLLVALAAAFTGSLAFVSVARALSPFVVVPWPHGAVAATHALGGRLVGTLRVPSGVSQVVLRVFAPSPPA